ncbi:DUF1799 domain-containing protein [Thiomicrorhabdus indica]|uniref:DUF1799 domain-containing protein n=1 Tax=Thiomicrorhabdus indica TaxID=2267253 RepID=UPI002AA68E9F|nr:DUF1799 domain-containing protein [Thiomicrorhabdus indica]
MVKPAPKIDIDEVQQQLIDLAGDDAPQLYRPVENDIEVMDENTDAVQLFQSLGNKWQKTVIVSMAGGMERFECIKPESIRLELEMNYPASEHKRLYNQLMIMERVALPLLNQRD